MALFPPGVLAMMRTAFPRIFLSDTCTLTREDGTAAGSVACRIKDPAFGSEAAQLQGTNLSANVKTIRFPVGTDVRRGDRISEGGFTYEAAKIGQNRTDEVLIDVVAVEIR
jgi:hypothetical protein